MTSSNYIERIADEIRAAVPSEVLPKGPIDHLFLAYAVLALAKGELVTPEDVHNAWASWMTSRDPHHESIKPYSELSFDDRREDDPFVSAIRTVASRLPGTHA